MSRKKLTQQKVQELKDNYWKQMNILNGNDALWDAVHEYVSLLEKEIKNV